MSHPIHRMENRSYTFIPVGPKERTDEMIRSLTEVWERSVRASHDFLGEEDIAALIPFVKEGLKQIRTLIIAQERDRHVGFIGIQEQKIEMLFLSPTYFGQGIGRQFVERAIHDYNVRFVDVNEQNPNAHHFYEHLGFEVFQRDENDEQGNPLPILRMRQKAVLLPEVL